MSVKPLVQANRGTDELSQRLATAPHCEFGEGRSVRVTVRRAFPSHRTTPKIGEETLRGNTELKFELGNVPQLGDNMQENLAGQTGVF